MNSYVLYYYVSTLPLEARSLLALLLARRRHTSTRRKSKACLLSFFLFIHHLYFCEAYPSHFRRSSEAIDDPRPSAIMHSTSTPTTSMPLKADKARRRGGHGRSKGHAIDGACTWVHRLYRRQRTPTPTRSPSRQGAVYTNTYTEPLEAGRRLHRCLQEPPRGRVPSTSTPTWTARQAGMAFTSSLLRHLHQHQ
jgi:hypothetical protein